MSDQSIYRVMIENALDAFFLTKPDGTILDANGNIVSLVVVTKDITERVRTEAIRRRAE